MKALEQLPRVVSAAQSEPEKIIDKAMREGDDKLVKYVAEVMEKAQQTAAGIINGAKRDAEDEAATIIAHSKEVAQQIIYNAKLRANTEVRVRTDQETKCILNEAKEGAIRIISGAKHAAEKESVRILANSKMETKANYQRSKLAEKTTGIIGKLAEQSARFLAAIKQKDNFDAKKRTRKKAWIDWKYQADEVSLKTDYDRLYQGRVKLEISGPVDFTKVMTLRTNLREVASLHISSVGGSTAGNTTIVVVLEEPLPIVRILAEIPSIRAIVNKGENIILLL